MSPQPSAEQPVIIDVAINGIRQRDMNPNIPIGTQEIADEAVRCLDAGASIIHAHNPNSALTGQAAADAYLATWRDVLARRPDALWYPTLVGERDPSRSGVEHVEILHDELGLRMGCIDPGSVNLGTGLLDGVPAGMTYSNSADRIRAQVTAYRKRGISAAFGIYEPGYLRTALAYERAGWLKQGSSINLYFIGDYGLLATEPASTCGLPPEPRYLDTYLALLEHSRLPWFVSIWGAGDADYRPLMRRVLAAGGHLQVGLEPHFHPTHKPTNIELLREAQALVSEAGRPLATRAQTAEILGLV